MKKLLFILIVCSSLNGFGQVKPDSVELKKFWNTQIKYLIDKDTNGLKETVNFPVSGLWSMFFGLSEPDEKMGEDEFFSKLDELLPNDLCEQLKKKGFQDVEIHNYYGFNELLVSYDRSVYDKELDMNLEGSLVFFYKKINGSWKLWSISIVGG